jgi:DNA-directed RNA polymerase subunit beta
MTPAELLSSMVPNVLLYLSCTVRPACSFGQSIHTNGTKLYSARIIPFKGSWIEFATDINNVMYAYIDRKKKLPVTTLLRAMGSG